MRGGGLQGRSEWIGKALSCSLPLFVACCPPPSPTPWLTLITIDDRPDDRRLLLAKELMRIRFTSGGKFNLGLVVLMRQIQRSIETVQETLCPRQIRHRDTIEYNAATNGLLIVFTISYSQKKEPQPNPDRLRTLHFYLEGHRQPHARLLLSIQPTTPINSFLHPCTNRCNRC